MLQSLKQLENSEKREDQIEIYEPGDNKRNHTDIIALCEEPDPRDQNDEQIAENYETSADFPSRDLVRTDGHSDVLLSGCGTNWDETDKISSWLTFISAAEGNDRICFMSTAMW